MRGLLVATALCAVTCAGACTNSKSTAPVDAGTAAAAANALAGGAREIERIQYNDVTDIYRVFLVGRLNPNEPERLQFLRLVHMPDSETKTGAKPYLKAEPGGPVAHIGAGFTIGLLHGFVEERPDLETGGSVSVVTRTEKKWWQPFGGKKLL